MEVDDVSHEESFKKLLQMQKAALQANIKRKGERPRDKKPLKQLIDNFTVSALQQTMMVAKQDRQFHLHQSWVAFPYPPSEASLKSLQPLLIKDLQLETHHRGFYILLRAATPANVMTAVMAVMEDKNGDGVVLQLYHQKAYDDRTTGDMMEKGFVCVVKEPYYKIMNDGDYGIGVDHVSDLVWLPKNDDKIPTVWQSSASDLDVSATQLKEEGNCALKAGNPYQAARLYTKALQHTSVAEERQVIQLNRALVYLKTGYYDQSLQDAGTYMTEKALYRASRALYELGKFGDCHNALECLLSEFPNCTEAQRELVRIEDRLKEQNYGSYDFKSMHKAALHTPPSIDCASLLGPVVVKPSQGRGRGLFTTRDVVAGELLLCEKAFAYCWASDGAKEPGSKTTVLMNMNSNRIVMGTQADLITSIVQKLYRNPSLIPAFNALHHGDHSVAGKTTVDGSAIVDTFLVDRTTSLNVFGCPRTSLETHFERSQTTEKRKKTDIFHTSGLFISASYINHSCDSNARRSFIGDMQIVRASRNIPADTEITFWYHVPGRYLSYKETQENFKNWDFTCTCSICEQLKNTPKKTLLNRKGLTQDLLQAFDARPIPDLAKAERLLTAIGKTYSVPASTVPRLTLWDPYLLVTRCYSYQKNYPKTIETAWKVFESLGYVIKREDSTSLTSAFEIQVWGLMHDPLVETWVHLWIAYAKCALELCSKVEEYAKIAYKICVGEDETFDERYGKLARRAISGEVDLVEAFQSMGL